MKIWNWAATLALFSLVNTVWAQVPNPFYGKYQEHYQIPIEPFSQSWVDPGTRRKVEISFDRDNKLIISIQINERTTHFHRFEGIRAQSYRGPLLQVSKGTMKERSPDQGILSEFTRKFHDTAWVIELDGIEFVLDYSGGRFQSLGLSWGYILLAGSKVESVVYSGKYNQPISDLVLTTQVGKANFSYSLMDRETKTVVRTTRNEAGSFIVEVFENHETDSEKYPIFPVNRVSFDHSDHYQFHISKELKESLLRRYVDGDRTEALDISASYRSRASSSVKKAVSMARINEELPQVSVDPLSEHGPVEATAQWNGRLGVWHELTLIRVQNYRVELDLAVNRFLTQREFSSWESQGGPASTVTDIKEYLKLSAVRFRNSEIQMNPRTEQYQIESNLEFLKR